MDKVPSEFMKGIVRKTGLREATVIDLLTSGWSYIEEAHRMPRWEKLLGEKK